MDPNFQNKKILLRVGFFSISIQREPRFTSAIHQTYQFWKWQQCVAQWFAIFRYNSFSAIYFLNFLLYFTTKCHNKAPCYHQSLYYFYMCWSQVFVSKIDIFDNMVMQSMMKAVGLWAVLFLKLNKENSVKSSALLFLSNVISKRNIAPAIII